MSVNGVIFNIQRFSVNDGPGIRTTVFMKGCHLGCGWCHNPEGRLFPPFGLNNEVIGRTVDTDELYEEIDKDRVFYEESGGGVTFSGGEPLAQPEFLKSILKKCSENGIPAAVDTSGYAHKALFKQILPFTGLFLYDIKLVDPVRHLKFTGVSNTEILENLDFLMGKNAHVIIRVPMIPEITATRENIDSIIKLLGKYSDKPLVNLLPFHRIADGKYNKFGIKNIMTGISELPETELQEYRNLFERSGFITKIGG